MDWQRGTNSAITRYTPQWDSMKSMVYGTPVTSEEDLIARVHEAIKSFTIQPHLLGRMYEAQHRQCSLCNDLGETQFEPRS